MTEEMHTHHSSHSGGNASNLLPYSILVAAIILGGSIWFSANTLSSALSDLSLNVGPGTQLPTAGNPDTGDLQAADPIPLAELAGSAPVLGDDSAEITVIEFSDFQCPYCSRFFTDSVSQLKSNNIDTGQVKLIYKQFPLNFHPYAQKAAEASLCAAKQGVSNFWEMHDKMFMSQAALSAYFNSADAQTAEGQQAAIGKVVADLKQYAVDLGMNAAQFNSCLDSDETASTVQAEYAEGASVGVSGTPSFVIGLSNDNEGTLLVGACPYSVFQQIFQAETDGKQWQQVPNTCEIVVS